MSKVKSYLLAGLLALIAVEVSFAAATKFTDLQCSNLTVTGALTSGGCTCTNISTATLTTTNIIASTVTLSGSQGLRLAPGNITAASTVPAAANILAHDSSNVLYISTGTGAGAWLKVGAQ